jgi:hypothetical protein
LAGHLVLEDEARLGLGLAPESRDDRLGAGYADMDAITCVTFSGDTFLYRCHFSALVTGKKSPAISHEDKNSRLAGA